MNITIKGQVQWRLYVIILCIFFIRVFMGPVLIAQEINTDKRIRISNHVLTIGQLLDELHNKYAVNFSYNDKNLPLKQSVIFKSTNLSLHEILRKLGEEAQIEYTIYNDLVILTPQKPKVRYTISGYIEDNSSGEKLLGASVYNERNLIGTISNKYGFYSLTLTEGPVQLVTSYVGYKQYEQDIDLKSDTIVLIKLVPYAEIGEVKIEAKKREYNTRSQLSVIKVTSKEVNQIPALLGEVDVLKSLQLLPGVQSGTEGSSGLVVRGGGADQNLIILDGVPVYNVNHLFGFFSVFNSNAIKDVTLYKSGFPARYGGRASSVIDINMKEGNNKEFKGEGSIGLISSKFTFEGPIKNENTSFIISGRRTYLDLLARPFLTTRRDGLTSEYGYYFYDLNMKINHRFSDKSRLFLSSYMGNDVFHYTQAMSEDSARVNTLYELKWGNITTNLRWNYMVNNKLFTNTTMSYSNYRFSLKNENKASEYIGANKDVTNNSLEFLNGIYDLSGKVDFDYFPNHNHIIKFGTGYYHHSFVPSSFTQKNDPGRDTSNTVRITGHEAFLYFEDDISIGQKVNANIGFHYSLFRTGKKIYSNLEPRISAKYSPRANFAFKASFSKMVQYLQTNSYSGISLPIDLWVPSTDSLKPVESWNYSFGMDYQPSNAYNFGVEGFYKNMKNVKAFKEGAYPNTNFLEDIVQGKGWAYGIEFMARKNSGKTTGWLAYTWSHSWRKFNGISFNQKFPYKYDRRNDISLVVMHKFNDRIDLSGTWVFATGNAISLSTEKYISNFALEEGLQGFQKPHIQVYGRRNNYRMPDYHRMDIGINFHKEKKRITRTWSFGAYNVYNRKNALWIYWDDSGQFADKKALYQISLYQIIPYFTYSFKF